MKKVLIVFTTVAIAGFLLSGCNEIKKMFENANGIIVYGDQKQIESVFEKEKKELQEKDAYSIKVAKVDEQKAIILDKPTAKALVEKELLRKIKANDETEALTKLPETAKDQNILFAKDTIEDVMIEEQKIPFSYEGNVIIGEGRVFGDMFLVVNNSTWSTIAGTEKTMGIMKYDEDPKKKLGDVNVEATQLVKIK